MKKNNESINIMYIIILSILYTIIFLGCVWLGGVFIGYGYLKNFLCNNFNLDFCLTTSADDFTLNEIVLLFIIPGLILFFIFYVFVKFITRLVKKGLNSKKGKES